jgi:hypothetical protein
VLRGVCLGSTIFVGVGSKNCTRTSSGSGSVDLDIRRFEGIGSKRERRRVSTNVLERDSAAFTYMDWEVAGGRFPLHLLHIARATSRDVEAVRWQFLADHSVAVEATMEAYG